MKRLAALITGAALLLGGLSFAVWPASAASIVWTFPDASFTVDNGLGSTGTFSYQNLRIDGSTARGAVRASAGNWSCSTSSFSGLDAIFTVGSFEACDGTVSFSVDASGALTVTSALKISYLLFYGPVGTAQASNQPAPKIASCDVQIDSAARTAAVSWTTEGGPFTGFDVGVVNGRAAVAIAGTDRAATVPLGTEKPGPLAFGIEFNGDPSTIYDKCPSRDYWPSPGAPALVGAPLPAVGQVTVNYNVADPITVQGIEYSLDAGATWTRPGGTAPSGGVGGAFVINPLTSGKHDVILRSVGFGPNPATAVGSSVAFVVPPAGGGSGSSQSVGTVVIGSSPSKPLPAPPVAPVSSVSGTSNGAGSGTNGALAASTGDAGIDAPCLAQDGTLYPNQYSTVGSQLTMAPNTHGMGKAKAFTVVAGALPAGMQLDRTFGVLFGVTSQQGSWVTTIKAKFADGSTKTSQFTTRVDADPQTLQYSAQNIGAVGAGIAIAPSTNAPLVGTTYELVCGKLPDGTRFDMRTGAITGKPTSVVSMPTPLRVAESSSSGKAAASFIFVVNKAGTTTLSYPAHPHVRAGKRVAIRPTIAGVGDIAVIRMWKGKLPKGLRLNARTGVISGRIAHGGPTHTITIVAVTKGGALLTAAPMRLRLQR